MALSGSMNGMSSLRTSTDRNILDNNFGNEAYSPEYDAYMCTNIGKQYTNYDNYYMNGLYTSMNVAKDSYHIKGRGNNAIFAVCRGVGDNEEAFNASRKVFEYLDKSRDEILNRKTISSIKKALRKFAEDCHSIFFKDAISKKYKISLLIVVYNNDSITVAIDELDSGIFEYLLGEILRIISEKGKGQLIFTSHNLRPLETIDKGFIAFTTTNVNNRYIRFSNVKNNNNLRDFYYRDIMLGEQDEPVYETTNNNDIALAFREAKFEIWEIIKILTETEKAYDCGYI